MKRFLYLFFIVIGCQIIHSQNTEPMGTTPETKTIDKELEEIHKKTKTFIDPKYEAPLLRLKEKSQKLGYEDAALRSGDYLVGLYVGIADDKKAVDLANELKKIARKKKDTYGHISSIYRRSGLSLGYLGLSDASLKDFQQAIKSAEEVENNDKKNRLLAFAYNNLNVYYLNKIKEKGSLDSMYSNFRKSLEFAKKISDKDDAVSIHEKYDLIADINMQVGILYLDHNTVKNRFELAEKYLLEAQKIYNDTKYKTDPINNARNFNELSRLYTQKKEPQKAIEYGEKALKYEKKHSGPFVRLQSYKHLLDAYLEIGDTEKSKFYKEKYRSLNDSISYEERKAANSTMKKMVDEVKHEETHNIRKLLILIGIIVLLAGIITAILWRRKNKTLRKNYEQIIEKLKSEASIYQPEPLTEINDIINEQQIFENKNTTISSHTEERILKGLQAFEKSEKYLRSDITISLLAGQLNTNSKYLSEVIKNNKSLSFSNYINTLRINHIIHKLYNEAKYRGYKISYLAEVCGYASPQVFVIAFKKINGVTPSYFIQNLNEDNM